MTRRTPDEPKPTKRLVAHVEPDPHEGDGRYGPRDGEAVSVPTSCTRLMAGYWCSCGSGFLGDERQEHARRARVETIGSGDRATRYVGDPEELGERGLPWPTRSDQSDLQESIERLPVGTVVERHGIGIGVAFDDSVRQPSSLYDGYRF